MPENKPIEKENIINEDEKLPIEPELETEGSSDEKTTTKIIDPAGDDSGGSTPPPEKGRG